MTDNIANTLEDTGTGLSEYYTLEKKNSETIKKNNRVEKNDESIK